MFRFVATYVIVLLSVLDDIYLICSKRMIISDNRPSEFQLFGNILTCSHIWFRFVPPSIVTHTGSYKQRNETEQKSCNTKTYYYTVCWSPAEQRHVNVTPGN